VSEWEAYRDNSRNLAEREYFLRGKTVGKLWFQVAMLRFRDRQLWKMNGRNPMKKVRVANLGNLLGSAVSIRWQRDLALILACAAMATSVMAQIPLASFNGTDGNQPNGLVQGVDGNFYGTTLTGGANLCSCGVIFKITASGTLSSLYSFGSSSADAMYPNAGLTLGSDGNLYGTTNSGGSNEGGTVFQFNPVTMTEKILWNFPMYKGDGQEPLGGLALGADGNFYGTTSLGGEHTSGMVFKITPSGVLTPLYSFCAESYPCFTTGSNPEATLALVDGAVFYGTTYSGGEHMSGTIFAISPTGTYTKLYDFESAPSSGLLLGTGGRLYGTIGFPGSIYEIGYLGGTLTTICTFGGEPPCDDGEETAGPLLLGGDGNLYGTTLYGGSDNDGIAYRISPAGSGFTVLHSFDNSDGLNPATGMIEATSGILYGTTSGGGANGDGTVFSLAVRSLSPFAETVPIAGRVGSLVLILGSNLSGATTVTFNGTSAKFEVETSTEILARVPSGATSGKVEVITPGGSLNSNVAFTVIP
jgi:uncharacterized repeat protein (TIGR03803 family)